MRKLALVVALAGLGACSTYDPNYTPNPPNPDPPRLSQTQPAAPVVASAPVVAAGSPVVPWRPGYGRVEAIQSVQGVPTRSAAASGGSTGTIVGPVPAYQLSVRMDDGNLQNILQDNPSFRVGDRIMITNDGRVIRL